MIQPAVRPWNTTTRSSKSYARPSNQPVANGAMGFRAEGACRKEDPEKFFPVTRQDKETPGEKAARRVCMGCPVLVTCRAWVLANPELTEFGVWAGLTEYQRKMMLRGLAGASS